MVDGDPRDGEPSAGDRTRALALAAEASEALAGAGPDRAEALAEVEAWLAAQRR